MAPRKLFIESYELLLHFQGEIAWANELHISPLKTPRNVDLQRMEKGDSVRAFKMGCLVVEAETQLNEQDGWRTKNSGSLHRQGPIKSCSSTSEELFRFEVSFPVRNSSVERTENRRLLLYLYIYINRFGCIVHRAASLNSRPVAHSHKLVMLKKRTCEPSLHPLR
jgi:hypothetical protein